MNFLPRFSHFFPYFPAIATGILLTSAFPGYNLYPVAVFALVPLWASIVSMTSKQAFYAGLAAGAVHYLTLVYWIIPTLTRFGGLHPVLALSCLVLLSLYLALYPAVFALVMKRWPGPAWLCPLWGAVVWTGLEFIRTYALTGFPWGVLGYSQYANLTFVQMADIFGVLGISFVLVVCNGCLTRLFQACRKKAPVDRSLFVCLAWGIALAAAAWGYGTIRLDTVDRLASVSPQTRVAVVQGNIEQDKKWDKTFQDFTLKQYETLSLESLPADLVIWPETALPFYYQRNLPLFNRVNDLVRKAGTHFLVGSPACELSGQKLRYYNRAYMLDPEARITGTHDKMHLVPFGEYVPLEHLLWFVEKLTASAGNFSKGETGCTPLAFGRHTTGVLICFEILFPDISRTFTANGAGILTTITNDAWFGRTAAAAQHFAIAVLRAVENRRSVVRSANTGISGVIDPAGRIRESTGLFTPATVTRDVPVLTTITFYTRHGDLAGIAALIAITLSFVVKVIKKYVCKPRVSDPI